MSLTWELSYILGLYSYFEKRIFEWKAHISHCYVWYSLVDALFAQSTVLCTIKSSIQRTITSKKIWFVWKTILRVMVRASKTVDATDRKKYHLEFYLSLWFVCLFGSHTIRSLLTNGTQVAAMKLKMERLSLSFFLLFSCTWTCNVHF